MTSDDLMICMDCGTNENVALIVDVGCLCADCFKLFLECDED